MPTTAWNARCSGDVGVVLNRRFRLGRPSFSAYSSSRRSRILQADALIPVLETHAREK